MEQAALQRSRSEKPISIIDPVANDFKCDGKLPACTACEKSGRAGECSSANDQFAKGKERRSVNPHHQDLDFAGPGTKTCANSLQLRCFT